MQLVLDVENTVNKRGGKKHFDPYEPDNKLVMVGVKVVGEDTVPRQYTFNHQEYTGTEVHLQQAHKAVQELLNKTTLLIGHNIGHDLQWLWESNFEYQGAVWDTMLAEYVMQRGDKKPLSLDMVALRNNLTHQKEDILKRYLQQGYTVDRIPYNELEEYLFADLNTTEDLYNDQLSRLADVANKGLQPIVDLSNETAMTLARIYRNGIAVDADALESVRKEFEQERDELRISLHKHVKQVMGDTPINLNSPEQMSWVVFSRKPYNKTIWTNHFDPYCKDTEFKKFIKDNAVPVRKTKAVKCRDCKGIGKIHKMKKDGTPFKKSNACKTCAGRGFLLQDLNELAGLKFNPPNPKWHSANGFSTSKDNLEYLERVATSKGMEEQAEFLRKLRRLSAVDTYITSFVDGISVFTKPDNLLHVRLTQHITATGRFSGRDPNMQNMPRGGTFPVKKVFVSRWKGGKVMEADFAQLEFRVAAYLSQDQVAIKEVTEGFDVHSYTAKVITEAGQPISRQTAKAHTFAPLYGATGFGRTPAEAAYYEQFTDKYYGIGEWHQRLAKEALTYQKITTPSGREFSFPNVKRRKNGTVTNFTAIKNYPVQSFATADIVPVVLIEIEKKLMGMQSLIVNSVHDSLVIDIHPEEVQEVVDIIKNMNDDLTELVNKRFNIDLNVPLLLEPKVGDNWLEQVDV